MRVRKVEIQAGSRLEWVGEFILKYSLDGKTFYCIDSCNIMRGVTDPRATE